MKLIILAAGIGSRLAPITHKKPKCLVKVGGRPILQHQIDSFIAAGIEKILIIGGYKIDLIRKFCDGYQNNSIEIIENPNYSKTNNMYSLYLIKEKIFNENFILCNGDVIYDPGLIESFVNSTEDDLIAADKGTYYEESMKIVVNNDEIIDISKNIPKIKSFGNSIDLYRFSKASSRRIFEEITKIIEDENKKNEWVEVALQRVLQNSSISMKPFDIQGKSWVEIDNFIDLYYADKLFSTIGNLKEKKVFLFDLDGTIYNGNQIIDKSNILIEKLQKMGKKIYFISNNSSKSKNDYVEKLKFFGLKVNENDIILSTDGVIQFLIENAVKEAYIIGTQSMNELFTNNGINTDSDNPQYVILGYDTELTYEKIKKASCFLQKDVKLLLTHCDIVCPSPDGFLPDAGSILALFEKAFSITPYKIFGKPNSEMIEHITRSYNPDDIVIIGDRLYTDIELAKRTGTKSVCVLSGETRREDIEESLISPDLILEDIGKMIDLF